MWHAGLVHGNQRKPVLARLTQQNPVLCASTNYDLKLFPFEYYTNYDHMKYSWEDRLKETHNPIHIWRKEQMIKHDPV